MPSNLSQAQRNYLQAMGIFVKELLYKASRDGCSPAAFHQKCDNKGPTLTLLHNTSGYVFGGCTFQSWTSGTGGTAADVADPKAFLFRLEDKGTPSPAKLPVSKPEAAIHCNSTLGPRFGAGPDLLVFGTQTFSLVDGTFFQLNGSCAIGSSYNATGLIPAAFMGMDFKIVEIQVFGIEEYRGQVNQGLLEKMWRPQPQDSFKVASRAKHAFTSALPDFTPLGEAEAALCQPSVESPQQRQQGPVQEAYRSCASSCWTTILWRRPRWRRPTCYCWGPWVPASPSFFNTIYSIFCGYVASKACSGSAEHSLSTKFRVYQVKDPVSRVSLNFRLCDTMGLEEGHGIDPTDVAAVLNGNVPDGYQFNPSSPINSNTLGFRKNPTMNDVIHCILFVIDSLSLEVFPEKILAKIRDIRQKANDLDIPQVVLLTKVDKLCALVEDNVGDTFRSPAVQEAVDQAAKLVGLPRTRILPIKNYESEADLDPEVDRLALMAMRSALRSADNFLDNRLDALGAVSQGQEARKNPR